MSLEELNRGVNRAKMKPAGDESSYACLWSAMQHEPVHVRGAGYDATRVTS